MPTVAEILAGIDSVVTPAKRRVVDMLMNPRAAMAQTAGRLSDDSNAALRDLNTQADANMLRAQGSVMADLPQYRQAEDASRQRMINALMNFAPAGMLNLDGIPKEQVRDIVRNKAEEIASTLRNEGFQPTVQHSGSAAGPSSYVRVFDPQTGRFVADPARVSNHSKGTWNSQFVHEIDDFPESVNAFLDLARQMRVQGPSELFKKQEDAAIAAEQMRFQSALKKLERGKTLTRSEQEAYEKFSK